MKTLWTFGCSHTLGHGLPDCIDSNGDPIPSPSSYAWPVHLSKLLNIPVINNSHAGIGPKAVWNNIINSDIQPDDIIVIMWPCWESRIDLLLEPLAKSNHALQIQAVRAWNEEDGDYFDNYYHKFDRWIEFHLLARHIQDNYSKNNKLIQTSYDVYKPYNISSEHNIHGAKLNPILRFDHTDIAFGMHKYCAMPLALDNQHLGEEAHKAFAQDLYTEVFA